jgi:hypothetical protein
MRLEEGVGTDSPGLTLPSLVRKGADGIGIREPVSRINLGHIFTQINP